MSPIPAKIRKAIAWIYSDYYCVCARSNKECKGRITWEHAFTYAGKQIQEVWAIIPLCWYHHLGAGLDKRVNQVIAAGRTTEEDRIKYDKIKWSTFL